VFVLCSCCVRVVVLCSCCVRVVVWCGVRAVVLWCGAGVVSSVLVVGGDWGLCKLRQRSLLDALLKGRSCSSRK
jgi:hypothetical protein